MTENRVGTGYFFPSSVNHALELKRELDARGKYIAGGTDLLLRLGDERPEALIDISRIPALCEITFNRSQIHIGAGVTYSQILNDAELMRLVPLLGHAVRTIGGVQVRNVATIVGNIVNASPAADTLPALYILNAMVHFTISGGNTHLPIDKFIVGPGQVVLPQNELVTGISFDIPGEDRFGSYQKLGLRRSMAIAVASVAVLLKMKNSKIMQARIALGAVAPTVIKASEAESILENNFLEDEVIEAAAAVASSATKPIDDVRGSAAFRTRVIKGLLRRTLNNLRTQTMAMEV